MEKFIQLKTFQMDKLNIQNTLKNKSCDIMSPKNPVQNNLKWRTPNIGIAVLVMGSDCEKSVSFVKRQISSLSLTHLALVVTILPKMVGTSTQWCCGHVYFRNIQLLIAG